MNQSTQRTGAAKNFAMPEHVTHVIDLKLSMKNPGLLTIGYEIEVSGRESGRDI